MSRWWVALLLAALVAPAALAQAPDSVPTLDDLRALYEKGNYSETLKQVSRVLGLKGRAAEGLDRYELLLLRAEAHLRLKATSAALPALEEAAKQAPDDEAASKARALALLVKRSKNLQYAAKGAAAGGKSGGTFDITDDESRPDALKALYEGERSAVKSKLSAAAKARTLPPIATALKAVLPLRDLEVAATGKHPETDETIQDLVQRAHKLMAKGLDDIAKRTERISDKANEIIDYEVTRNGRRERRSRRRGLDPTEARELKGMVDTCRKVIASCEELTEGFAEEDDEQFEDLAEQARDTGERAHDVLSDNYQSVR